MLLAGCAASLGEPGQDDPAAPGKGDGSGSGAPITATRYVEGVDRKECDEAFACQSQFPSDLGYAFADVWSTSQQACYDLLEVDWKPATIETEIVAQRITYDGLAATQCLAQISFGDCVDFFHAGPHWAEPCYRVMKAMVPVGGSCELDFSCLSNHCDSATRTCM